MSNSKELAKTTQEDCDLLIPESLNEQEVTFCKLVKNGLPPYLNNEVKSYQKVYGGDVVSAEKAVKKLMKREDINEYMLALGSVPYDNENATQRFIMGNLLNIMDECSRAVYYDRRGTQLSPAALRSVAVNAAKTLMDMQGLGKANENNLNINTGNGTGITFNVVVPTAQPAAPEMAVCDIEAMEIHDRENAEEV